MKFIKANRGGERNMQRGGHLDEPQLGQRRIILFWRVVRLQVCDFPIAVSHQSVISMFGGDSGYTLTSFFLSPAGQSVAFEPASERLQEWPTLR